MPRPKKLRFIAGPITCRGYVPEESEPDGVVELPLEGVEAIRLRDCEGLDHEQAAVRMGISRQTYGRVLAEARRTVAQALVGGKRLRVVSGASCVGGRRRRMRKRGNSC